VDQLQPVAGDLAGVPTLPHYTIKFLAAVAKENNRGTINSAQKAGRTVKAGPKSREKGKGKQV
jgi:hypothetical protein